MTQMNIFDFLNDAGTGFEISDQTDRKPKCQNSVKTCSKCKYRVFLHDPKNGNARMSCDRKYGCKFEPRLKCSMCSHFAPYVSGLNEEYHGWACFGFGISRSSNPDQEACADFKEGSYESWANSHIQ